jgi:hypothetical protein
VHAERLAVRRDAAVRVGVMQWRERDRGSPRLPPHETLQILDRRREKGQNRLPERARVNRQLRPTSSTT